MQVVGELSPTFSFSKMKVFPRARHREQNNSQSVFDIIIYEYGGRKLLVYTLEEKSSRGTDGESKNASIPLFEEMSVFEDLSEAWDCDLQYQAILQVEFPVVAIVNTVHKVWAVGHEELMDISDLLHKGKSCSSTSSEMHFASSRDSNNLSAKRAVTKKCRKTTACEAAETAPNKKLKLSKKHPVCFVTACFADCLLICREDDFMKNWTVEILLEDASPGVFLSSVPFGGDFPNHIAQEMSYKQHSPVLMHLAAEGLQNTQAMNILDKNTFLSMFGPLAVSSCSVVVFGAPDGRVLWNKLSTLAYGTTREENDRHTFELLYDIEQPVTGIYLYKKEKEERYITHIGSVNSVLLVIGAFGKVALLSLSSVNQISPLRIVTCFIPAPVSNHFFKNTCLYYTADDGQLWMSTLNYQALLECENKYPTSPHTTRIHSRRAEMTDIMLIAPLNELFLFINCNGVIYVGREREIEFLDEKKGEQPCSEGHDFYFPLKSVWLQQLQSVRMKQTVVFKQLSSLASLVKGGFSKVDMSCSITKSHSDFFRTKITFHDLQKMTVGWGTGLEGLHFCLAVSKSTGCSTKIVCPFLSCADISVDLEVKNAFTQLMPNSTFPWTVEVMLVFCLSEEYQALSCFDAVKKIMPLHVTLRTLMLNPLCLIKTHTQKEHQAEEQEVRAGGVFSLIFHLSKQKRVSMYNCVCYAWSKELSVLPRTFRVSFSASTAKSLIENAGSDICRDVLQHIFEGHIVPMSKQVTFFEQSSVINTYKKNDTGVIAIEGQSFDFLITLRIFVCSVLIGAYAAQKCSSKKSVCLSVPLLEKLEAISAHISDLQSEDQVFRPGVDLWNKVLRCYEDLRKLSQHILF